MFGPEPCLGLSEVTPHPLLGTFTSLLLMPRQVSGLGSHGPKSTHRPEIDRARAGAGALAMGDKSLPPRM